MRGLLVFLAVMAAAFPAWSRPRVTPPNSTKPYAVTVTFATGDTSESQEIPVSGFCTVRYEQVSGDDASLYAIASADDSTSAGTLIAAFTSSTTAATTFTAGTSWVKAVATDATAGGSVMTIECAPATGSGSGGAPAAEYAALSSIDETTITHVTVIDCDDLTCASPGTGSTRVPFYYNGSAWVPFPGAAAGIASVSADSAPVLSNDLDANGFDITGVAQLDSQIIGDVYYCDQYAGADIWAKCQAAFDAAVAANARAVILELPRGSYAVTGATLDLCDDRSGSLNYGVTLRGQGSATAQGGTRINFNTGFQSTAVSDTFTFGNDGTRDTITRSSGSWLTDGFKRGDLIETTGFSTATNNYPRTGGTETEAEHLKVYRATATVLTVESETAVGTTLPSSGSEAGNVRRLKAAIETCGSGAYVENMTLITTANYADILVHHRPDNNPVLACSAANVPYTTYCTGSGTGTGMSSIGGVNGGVSKVYGFGGRFGVAITSLENGGQADHYRIEDSHFHTNRVAVYYDSMQAQPGVKIENSQLEAFTKNGARVASGSLILDDTTVISAAADCIADTFGPCHHVYMGYENVDSLILKGRSFIEVKGGSGITVADGGDDPVYRRTLNLGTSRILANTAGETDIALVDAPDACLTVEMPGTRFTSGVDPTNAPTVTFGNSQQGSTCDSKINGHWSVADTGSGGGTYTPVVTVNDGIPVSVYSDAANFGGGTLEVPNGTTLPATCTVGQIYMDTDATSGQRIYACQSTNTWALQGDGGSGSGAFSDASDPVVLNTTTKDVVIGTGAVNSSKLTVDGDADQVQLTVQGNGTQTDSVIIVETSAGTETLNVEASGLLLTAVGVDAIGAVDMDYGSADVTDHTFLTDGTGNAEIVLPTGSIGSTEILDGDILEADLKAVDTASDEECLTYEATGGDFEWQSCGSGSGAFSDSGDPIVQNTTTKDVVIGTSAVNTSKLTIDGDADQVQLTVQGNSSQTDSVVIVENSGGTEVVNINNGGEIYAQSLADIDGPGTNWSIAANGNATFVSVTTAATSTPTISLDDSEDTGSPDAAIIANCPTAGDCDMSFQADTGGSLTEVFRIDTADAGTQSVIFGANIDTGAFTIDSPAKIATSTGGTLATNTITMATAAADYDLPDECDSATGAWATLMVRDVSETASLTVLDTGDTIVYKGLTLGANDELDSPGAALDSVTVVCIEADKWYVTSNSGSWTDGGVAD